MKTRDKISTFENFKKIIDFYSQSNLRRKEEIASLKEDLKNGVNRYKKPTPAVIKSTYRTMSLYQRKIMFATYSAGYPLEDFKGEYIKYVDSLFPVWYSNSGYDEMLWALSIGILLEIDEATFDKLVDLVKKDDPEDYLIDYLIQSRHPDWPIRINYNFPQPYGFTRKIIEEDSEKALTLLKEYITKKWYPGHRDTGWYDLHKRNIDNYYGYWSFESGALCKLKGLDYKELEGLPYFPYNLVADGAQA